MSYKTILVHVDASPHCASRVQVAATLARAHGAHLIGAAMTGISHYVYANDNVDFSQMVVAMHVEAMQAKNRAALAQFDAVARAVGVDSFESRLLNDDPESALVLQARYADLVVVSQTDVKDASARVTPGLPAYTMLASGRPVLVVPYAGTFAQVGSKVLLAWDGGMEATRALTAALPLLVRAAEVCVAVFNADETHGAQPGADIALYLARHGITVTVTAQRTGIDVGEALLSLAADQQSDLIVMGGYGHTRLRELLLGGVTETVLGAMTAPVLMAH
ncbi:universal stress protein [Massilia sp. CF038]|uniref:universal stress protein n=1 Tax=Massilia sp. CF038 TaxID=1881045 RepID=UPI000923C9CD|nr:universal stress protein [Massilia sp. CF038]SHH01403.1 Nucleotide-binding universal stress protein, UspA family [Massilia sp. CF038]